MRSTLIIIPALLAAGIAKGGSLDLNFGTTLSKSILGLSYVRGDGEVNIGLKGFEWVSSEGLTAVQPGITYIHRLTENDFYAGIGYIASHSRKRHGEWAYDSTTATWRFSGTRDVRGWDPSNVSLGVGKSFRLSRWGLHLDANVYTPIDDRFGKSWAYRFGAGGSCRFKISD